MLQFVITMLHKLFYNNVTVLIQQCYSSLLTMLQFVITMLQFFITMLQFFITMLQFGIAMLQFFITMLNSLL